MKYYAIKDNKVNLFNEPFAASDSDHATLIVKSMITRSQLPVNTLKRIHNNCTLVSVGSFDIRSGTFGSDTEGFSLDLADIIPEEDSDG